MSDCVKCSPSKKDKIVLCKEHFDAWPRGVSLEEYAMPAPVKLEPVIYKPGQSGVEDYPYMKDEPDDPNT